MTVFQINRERYDGANAHLIRPENNRNVTEKLGCIFVAGHSARQICCNRYSLPVTSVQANATRPWLAPKLLEKRPPWSRAILLTHRFFAHQSPEHADLTSVQHLVIGGE